MRSVTPCGFGAPSLLVLVRHRPAAPPLYRVACLSIWLLPMPPTAAGATMSEPIRRTSALGPWPGYVRDAPTLTDHLCDYCRTSPCKPAARNACPAKQRRAIAQRADGDHAAQRLEVPQADDGAAASREQVPGHDSRRAKL